MHTSEVSLGKQVERIKTLVEHRYDLQIDSSNPKHLTEVRDHYRAKRTALLSRLGEARAYSHPDYAKAVFIAEAAQMLLREIAPKRRKKISRSKS